MVILGPAQSTSLSLLGKSLAQLAHQLFWSIRRLYSRPGHFYWPTIRIKQCDGLLWRNPGKCVASRRRVFHQWAIVFRCTNRWCYLVGIWYYGFLNILAANVVSVAVHSTKKCNRSSWTCQCPNVGHDGVPCQPSYWWDWRTCRSRLIAPIGLRGSPL